MVKRYLEWKADPVDGALPIVSSIRVHLDGTFDARHATIEVWNRGALTGSLIILRRDWPQYVRIFGFDPGACERCGHDYLSHARLVPLDACVVIGCTCGAYRGEGDSVPA